MSGARLRQAYEAGIISGVPYYLKLRQHIALCISADSSGGLCLSLDCNGAAQWMFEPAGDGYFHIQRFLDPSEPRLYLSYSSDSDTLHVSGTPASWSVELHGRWQFLALIEKGTGKHISADPSIADLAGSGIGLRSYVTTHEWTWRHWRLVPVGGRAGGPAFNDGTVICIGDLHGHIDRCHHLWSKLESSLGKARLDAATVLFLGDYCDRGPQTAAVYDWLISLRDSRQSGRTAFITGNHDFAFASFLGCAPAEYSKDFDLDATNSKAWGDGFWPHPADGGMHYQGRRWGGSDTYNSSHTFRSYGLENDYTPEARDRLIAAVPQAHKDFLRSLPWVYEQDVPYPPGRIIAVHAGLRDAYPAEEQLVALRRRRVDAAELQRAEFGRFDVLSGRENVTPMHPDLEGKAILVSGHHGFRTVDGDRFILDLSGGKEGRPLEALVLPERHIISTNDLVGPSEGLGRALIGRRMQAAWEAGVIPGMEYFLKLRRDMSFYLTARSSGHVQVWNSFSLHQQWLFELAEEGYFRLRNLFHMQHEGGSPSYLACDIDSGTLHMSATGALWSLELHGGLHFAAFVEKDSGKHLALDFGQSPERGAQVRLETYKHADHFEHRHWSLALVPASPAE